MRTIVSILAIVLAGGLFFAYTKPTYDSIQATQAQVQQYNAALDKATQLQELKQTLLSRYNSFSQTDLSRLNTMLPDSVNNIGLILDLDTLASKFGMSLENVNIGSSDGTSGSSEQATAVGSPTQQYGSLDVSFSVHGTYSQFIEYITSLETSLRIVDLIGLQVTAGAGSSGGPAGNQPSNVYSYNVTLRTYWLK